MAVTCLVSNILFVMIKQVNIFDKINELNLSNDTFVVVGGGILVALDLLEWDEDIDLCVTPKIFARFQAKGWQQKEWAGKPILKQDVYDIGVGFGGWSLEDLQADAMVIKGIPFISVEKLLRWKQEMGRPKDSQHIELIMQYLQDHKTIPTQ